MGGSYAHVGATQGVEGRRMGIWRAPECDEIRSESNEIGSESRKIGSESVEGGTESVSRTKRLIA